MTVISNMFPYNLIKLFVLIGLLFFTPYSYAQNSFPEPGYRIKKWTTENGLPQNSVNAIIQSSDGYIWIGTYGGLTRFNGVKFKRVEHPQLKFERVVSLFEDANKHIWIGSENNGLYCLKGDDLLHFTTQNGLPGLGIADIFETSDHKIGLVIQRRGIAYVENGKVQFKQYNVFFDALLDQAIVDLKGHIWVSSSRGVFRLKSWDSDPEKVEGIQFTEDGRALAIGENGKIHFADQRGCYEIDVKKMHARLLFEHKINLMSEQLLLDPKGGIWYGGREKGLFVYKKNRIQNWSKGGEFPIPEGEISCLFHDRENKIWVGINGGGLLQLSENPISNLSAKDGLKDEIILAIHQDYQQNLWIGTNSGSFYKREKSTGQILEFIPEQYNIKSDVWSIASDQKGNIWIGSFGNGISHWNQKTTSGFQRITNSGAESEVILALHYDTLQDRLLMGTDRGGVFQWKNEQWTTLISEGLTKARVTQIVVSPSAKHEVYVATQGDGIQIIDKNGVQSIDESNGLPFNSIRSILFDNEGVLWLGSYGKGLFVQLNNEFKVINSSHGLFDDLVSSINQDQQSYLWMSCNNGVFRVKREYLLAVAKGDLKTVQSQVFNKSHGMGDSETNGGFQPSSVCLEDGSLLYPTMKGVSYFKTNQLTEEPTIKYLQIEQLSYGDTLVKVREKTIVPKQYRDIGFHYSAPSFNAPELITFEYFLEGYDREWKSSGNNRFVNYTRLAPGEYTFKLRVRNSEGVLSKNEAKTGIKIEPYLYETLFFKVLCALLVIALIGGYFINKQRQAKKREVALQKEVQAKTKDLQEEKELTERALEKVAQKSTELEKVNRAKSVFFSNISHELKTPLTLIKGPLENLLSSEDKQLNEETLTHLKLAQKNSEQLNHLITQLLDIARSEDGKLEVHEKSIDAKLLMEQLINNYKLWIDQKEIQLVLKTNKQSFIGMSDPNLLEKIVANLISNALKFTPQKGNIQVELIREKDTLSIHVEDSGPGIDEEDLPFVFDRFYKAKDSKGLNQLGSGIGLALVKEFVELLGGTIAVFNKEIGGAIFSISLPFIESKTKPIKISTSIKKEVDTKSNQPNSTSIQHEKWPLVLVVEDHANIRLFIKNVLEKSYRVIEAENGEEGYLKAVEFMPDLIVSDIMMPRVDGMEFLSRLKANPITDFIAVLFLTARGSEQVRIEGWKEGAEGYLAKPFNVKELQYRVEGILNNRKKLRSKVLLDLEQSVIEGTSNKNDFQIQFEQLIQQQIPEPEFSFTDVLTDFSMSRSSFQRAVKEHYNCSPLAYLKTRRLMLAKELLTQRKGSIAEVAYACGFNSISYFNRAFKEQFRTTPSNLLNR